MEISVENALSIIQNELETFIYNRMEEGKISAGLMEKIIESILCEIRKLKNQDLEKLILKLNSMIPKVTDEKIQEHRISIENLEEQNGSLQGNS